MYRWDPKSLGLRIGIVGPSLGVKGLGFRAGFKELRAGM